MTHTLTPEEARKAWECPVARVMAKPGSGGMCKGDACAAWRYLPIMANDETFKGAVQREILLIEADMQKAKDAKERKSVPAKDLLHKQAVARVAADPSAYCVPAHHTRGYCGLGSKP